MRHGNQGNNESGMGYGGGNNHGMVSATATTLTGVSSLSATDFSF